MININNNRIEQQYNIKKKYKLQNNLQYSKLIQLDKTIFSESKNTPVTEETELLTITTSR